MDKPFEYPSEWTAESYADPARLAASMHKNLTKLGCELLPILPSQNPLIVGWDFLLQSSGFHIRIRRTDYGSKVKVYIFAEDKNTLWLLVFWKHLVDKGDVWGGPYARTAATIRAELEAKEKAEQEAREKAELEAKERAEQEAQEKAELEAKEKAEQEAREKAELEAKERAEQEAQEKAELEAKEKAEQEAREKAELEAKERAEQEAREKAELEAKERAEREAREKAELDASQGFIPCWEKMIGAKEHEVTLVKLWCESYEEGARLAKIIGYPSYSNTLTRLRKKHPEADIPSGRVGRKTYRRLLASHNYMKKSLKR